MTITTTALEFDKADRLRKSLRLNDIEVSEMAEYLGVSRNSVSAWINGRTTPHKQTLMLWAARTGVPLSWLESGTLDDVRPEGFEPPAYWSVADDASLWLFALQSQVASTGEPEL